MATAVSAAAPDAGSEAVLLTRHNRHIAVVRINRPHARNAVNTAVARALGSCVQMIESDPQIRVAILTGVGRQAFCAGADLKELAGGSPPGERSTGAGGFAGFVRAPREKVWIAAVNGAAVAGGFELVLACDFAIASVGAVFGLPEVQRGLCATAGGIFRLPRAIPRGAALELIATGDVIDAARALQLGLVNHVVATEEVLPEALRIAERISRNAPLAVSWSLELARRAPELPEASLWAEAEELTRRVMATGDAREGPIAFAQRREPQWTGKEGEAHMTEEPKILATALHFPEGPVAMPDGTVLFVEIAAGRLSRLQPDGRVETVATPGGGPNGAAIGPDGACYVCNNGGFLWHTDPNGGRYPHGRARDYDSGRIERIDLATGRFERLYERTDRGPLSGPNDIVFDAHGGFWFTDLGSMGESAIERGRICYAKTDGSLIRDVVFPMLTPNGIGLSPDGKILYVAETVTARVWAFDLAGPGELTLRPWPAFTPGNMLYASPVYCMFDSLGLEAGGNVCVATIGPPGIAGVTVLSPQGELVERVPMPDRSTTNICFGGKDLRTAYVTLSRSGRLAEKRWSRAGLELAWPAG